MKEKMEFIRDECIKANPSIKDLVFGCRIEKIFWYESEEDKREGHVSWEKTGISEYGKDGTVVKDLRKEWLPMWIDCGDQLEFEIQPNDIVSFEIIGRDIRLADILVTFRDIWVHPTTKKNQGFRWLGLGLSNPGIQWNLLKDRLEDQSPETIDFIHDLLSK